MIDLFEAFVAQSVQRHQEVKNEQLDLVRSGGAHMTDIAIQLLAAFEKLPAEEQHEVLVQLLRRTGDLPGSPLTDDALVSVADQLFQSLDAEEANGDNDRSR